tara:strand:+ start:88 stop:645 length:558 start_codon:yes stop_codon:yes gene_type:complete
MKYLLRTLFFGLSLSLFAIGSAEARNEYLNEYGSRCGDFETRITQSVNEDQQLQALDRNFNNGSRYLSLTYRKYLGVDCKTIRENVDLKQQLELMKMCGRVNANPSLAHNKNFRLLVMKCRGIDPVRLDNRPDDGKSKWDELKDDYKKENPDITLMNDKIIGPKKSKLKIPPKGYIMPLPKPKDE